MAKPWIGTINSKEMSSLAHINIVPVGQVFGASVRTISTLYFPITSSEINNEIEAFQMMLETCMNALIDQTRAMGANGVIDVKFTHQMDVDNANSGIWLLTSKMVGTAVQDKGHGSDDLYTAGITANELVILRKAGFEPCSIAIGNSVYYKVAWRQVPKTGPFGFWANQEVTELTEGPYIARELAMSRMGEMARKSGGTGIIGVTAESDVKAFGTLTAGNMAALCRMRLVGTAIRRNLSSDPTVLIKPILSIS